MRSSDNCDSLSHDGEADRALLREVLSTLEVVEGEERRRHVSQIARNWNERYLTEWIEGRQLCPFARDGRRRGATHRRVHLARSASPEVELLRLLDVAREVLAEPNHEVTQLLFPGWALGHDRFDRFARALTRVAHDSSSDAEVLAVAPLHPHVPYNDTNAFALIPLFRRAPDPTIQWVRHDALARVALGKEKGSTFVDPSQLLSLLDQPAPTPLYDCVAGANQRTAREMGITQLERELALLHGQAQRQYSSRGAAACLCSVVTGVDAEDV